MINWMHMKSKEFGDTDYSCFKIEQDCHCEDRTKARDAAIHRVSRNADGFVCSLTGSQWIATGYALAITKWWTKGTIRG